MNAKVIKALAKNILNPLWLINQITESFHNHIVYDMEKDLRSLTKQKLKVESRFIKNDTVEFVVIDEQKKEHRYSVITKIMGE